MIRPDPHREGLVARLRRRQALRLGLVATVTLFLGQCGGFFTGVGAALPGFFRPLKVESFGGKVVAGSKDEILAWFKDHKDEPLLNVPGRFFVLHPEPDRLMAVFRKCTHLGCTVPWNASEDQFHCPCHGSLFDKHTAVVRGGPAPRPMDVFPISIDGNDVVVDTNPSEGHLITRRAYDPNSQTVKV